MTLSVLIRVTAFMMLVESLSSNYLKSISVDDYGNYACHKSYKLTSGLNFTISLSIITDSKIVPSSFGSNFTILD